MRVSTWGRRRPAWAIFCAEVALLAAGSSWAADVNRVLAQATTPGVPSAEKIRAQAARLKEFRDLLSDRDTNVRLATMDELLKSSDQTLRDLAFDAGFASADQSMRSVALRSRILSINNLVLEVPIPAEASEDFKKAVNAHFGGGKVDVPIAKGDPQTGNFFTHGGAPGLVSGLDVTVAWGYNSCRMRLIDGAVLQGTMTNTYYKVTVPVRASLR